VSILEQVKRNRVIHVGRPAPADKPANEASQPKPSEQEAAQPIAATVAPTPAPPARHLSYGVQPVAFASDPHSLEWTSAVNRSLRLQAERREADEDLKSRIHEDLISELDPEQLAGDVSMNSPIRRAVEQTADDRLGVLDPTLNRTDRTRLAVEIADEVLGFGPLEPLLRDAFVTEVMVNGFDRIFFERSGGIHLSEYRWLMHVCLTARVSTRSFRRLP
jgi:pilus assembly protein CpaF